MESNAYNHTKHDFLDYGENRRKCPCGEYEPEDAGEDATQRTNRQNKERSGAAEGTRSARGEQLPQDKPVLEEDKHPKKDEAKTLNDKPGEDRQRELEREEQKMPSRPTTATPDNHNQKAAQQGAPKDSTGGKKANA